MRLIDADALLAKTVPINVGLYVQGQDVVFSKDIKESPTVPAELVTYCQHCRHYYERQDKLIATGHCEMWGRSVFALDYCSRATKKEDE